MSAYSFSRPLYKEQHSPASPYGQTAYAPFHEDSDAEYPYDRPTPAPSYRSLPQSYGAPTPPIGTSGQHDFDQEPFGRTETISLDNRRAKHGSSTATIAPILPTEEDDPFVRDIDPRKARRRRMQQDARNNDGWFSGRITWVVYVLTVVQLAVFVAEIVKNGAITYAVIK